MPDSNDVARLSEREATLVLQHLTSELAPMGERINAVADPDAAIAVLEAFVEEAERQGISSGEEPARSSERSAIELALSDEQTRELAEELLADPPQDDQLGIVELAPHVATLGFLVTYLQTRFRVRISRSGGRTEASFEITKEATPADQILPIARGLLSGGNAQ
jgi:hypothetical protein